MLLQLHRKVAITTIDQFDFDKLIEGLSENGFEGAIGGVRGKIADLFAVPLGAVTGGGGRVLGELFFTGDDKLIYLKCKRTPGGKAAKKGDDPFADPGQTFEPEVEIEAGHIAPVGTDVAELESFCQGVSMIVEVQLDGQSFEWEDPGTSGEALVGLGEAVARPGKSDLELAGILREPKLQPFLVALQQNKGEVILDEWIKGRDDADEIEYFIDKLFEADFLTEEVIVYSLVTGQALIRAKNRAGLETIKAAGIRDVNGGELDLENVRRMLIMPADKAENATASWVGRVILLDLLAKLGIEADRIVDMEATDNCRAVAALFDGQPYVFMLADDAVQPRDFADLAANIKKLGEPIVVVVSDKDCDTDAARAAGASDCVCLTGVDEFNTKLLDRLSESRQEAIEAAMAEVNSMYSFQFTQLAMRRFRDEG